MNSNDNKKKRVNSDVNFGHWTKLSTIPPELIEEIKQDHVQIATNVTDIATNVKDINYVKNSLSEMEHQISLNSMLSNQNETHITGIFDYYNRNYVRFQQLFRYINFFAYQNFNNGNMGWSILFNMQNLMIDAGKFETDFPFNSYTFGKPKTSTNTSEPIPFLTFPNYLQQNFPPEILSTIIPIKIELHLKNYIEGGSIALQINGQKFYYNLSNGYCTATFILNGFTLNMLSSQTLEMFLSNPKNNGGELAILSVNVKAEVGVILGQLGGIIQ